MPELNINLSDAIEFIELEDGTYPCTVTEISEVKHGEKSSYVTATLVVNEGEERAGARCWQNLPIDGKGAGILITFINAALGTDYSVSDLRDEGFSVDTDELIGCEVNVVIKQHEYPEGSGEMKAQVHKVLAP